MERAAKRWSRADRSRYTDLQPVGMGAFGLVWYGKVDREDQYAYLTML